MLEADEVRVAVEAAAFGVRDRQLSDAGAAAAIPGGSCVGRVAEAGEAATDWLERRVIVPRLGPCGECRFCRRGAPAGCPDRRELGGDRDGTLAASVAVRSRWLAPADGALEVAAPGAAILGDDALVAYTLFCRSGVAAGEPVVCVGSGPRSTLLAQIAAAKGARVCAVTDVAEVSGEDFDARPWRVFALDGASLGALPPGSTIALAGGATADVAAMGDAAVSAVAGEHGHPDLLPELIALAARGDLDLDAVVAVVDSAADAAAALGARIPVLAMASR